jgi:predicted AlkP superfamily phosphohydrolase/phosphomutase
LVPEFARSLNAAGHGKPSYADIPSITHSLWASIIYGVHNGEHGVTGNSFLTRADEGALTAHQGFRRARLSRPFPSCLQIIS